jgi:hypothetical protein
MNPIKPIILAAVLLGGAPAVAAGLPDNFLGKWEDVTITENSIDGGPWNCSFTSVKRGEGNPSPAIVDMSCEMRRGVRWKTHEVWSVQTIGDQEILIRADSKSIDVYHRGEE